MGDISPNRSRAQPSQNPLPCLITRALASTGAERACVIRRPDAWKREALPGAVSSGNILSLRASSSDDPIYCKVVLCRESTYPQAQSRCSERPAPAHKEPFGTFPTSIPLTGKFSRKQACPAATPKPKTRSWEAGTFPGWQRRKAQQRLYVLASAADSKGTARLVPQPHPIA